MMFTRILNQAAKPVDLGVVLVQLWCKWGGKDGNYAPNGQIIVNSIERMDTVFPQIQDGQSSRTIRSQTLYPLSYGCVVGRLYLFRGEKSRNVAASVYLGSILWFSGAINAKKPLFDTKTGLCSLVLPSKWGDEKGKKCWRLTDSQSKSYGVWLKIRGYLVRVPFCGRWWTR